jgi:hypothetical protein
MTNHDDRLFLEARVLTERVETFQIPLHFIGVASSQVKP